MKKQTFFALILSTLASWPFAACWMVVGVDKTDLVDGDDVTDGMESETGPDEDASDVPDDGDEVEPSCWSDADCRDLEPCNGMETCSPEGSCLSGSFLPDGTGCTSQTGLSGFCDTGICIPDTCGNGTIDDGEECDDSNEIAADGCEPNCVFTCHEDAECDNTDPCREEHCLENDNGKICTGSYTTSECDDEDPCTVTDLCDGLGDCRGSGNPCNDALSCTNDICTVDGSGGYTCSNGVLPGTCRIDGECYSSDDPNPANQCLVCRSSEDDTAWSHEYNLTRCGESDAGACCDGVCVTGAECCADGDCTGLCIGTPAACSTYSNDSCASQAGCTWTPHQCTGSRGQCNIPFDRCTRYTAVCNCIFIDTGEGVTCAVDPLNPLPPCSAISEENCDPCGCSLDVASSCDGAALACDLFSTVDTCEIQDGCDFVTTNLSCNDHQCQHAP